MEEFAKVTPGIKKLLEYLRDLKPFEHLDIKITEDGRVDTFIVMRQTKVVVNAMGVKYIK